MIRRNTNQSQIVYKSIEFMGHTTSEKLIEYINSNYENISLATIYRNLSKLLDEGQIRKLRLGNDEIYETVKENHYHFKCQKCGMIYDIEPAKVKIPAIEDIDGNEVINTDIMMVGICKFCKNVS
ncbi:MAG: transcriptional repressor [Acholeplasmatales bacterium]|nr:transcriptional repressor [Acholeplasmatales bacterium]